MCATARDEAADRAAFYELERGRVAGGFLRVSRAMLPSVAAAFREELSAALATGRRPNEQQVLAGLAARRPDLFDLYPGDYASVLCNWDLVRRDLETVLLNVRHCRAWGLWRHALVLCERIGTAVASGALAPNFDDRARWLDEYLVVAVALGEHTRARHVARRLLETGRQSAYFARERDRILRVVAPLLPLDRD
jgi:hypothetical protein